MLFFPYKFDLALKRVPYVTILVSLLCLAIYSKQYFNESEFSEKTYWFCSKSRSHVAQLALEKSIGDASARRCVEFMFELGVADNPEELISGYAEKSKSFAGLSDADSKLYIRDFLADEYQTYRARVPAYTTKSLWYEPASWNPVTMVTSSFSHGSWDHVIGNLIFFYAFAAAVELIVGSLAFVGVIMAMVFGTSISYSLAMMSVTDALPTVGLSGIVMGMIAMLAFFMPTAKIRCFYWFIVKIGTVAVSAWVLALFYVGLDVYTLMSQDEMGGINLVGARQRCGHRVFAGYAVFSQAAPGYRHRLNERCCLTGVWSCQTSSSCFRRCDPRHAAGNTPRCSRVPQRPFHRPAPAPAMPLRWHLQKPPCQRLRLPTPPNERRVTRSKDRWCENSERLRVRRNFDSRRTLPPRSRSCERPTALPFRLPLAFQRPLPSFPVWRCGRACVVRHRPPRCSLGGFVRRECQPGDPPHSLLRRPTGRRERRAFPFRIAGCAQSVCSLAKPTSWRTAGDGGLIRRCRNRSVRSEAPKIDQRTHRDVERPLRIATDVESACEQCAQFWRNGMPFGAVGGVEQTQLRPRPVGGRRLFDRLQFRLYLFLQRQ